MGKESYNVGKVYGELEVNVRDNYHKGFADLKECSDFFSKLDILNGIFIDLENSHSAPRKGIEWARDVIDAYRNLGNVLLEICSSEDYIKLRDAVEDVDYTNGKNYFHPEFDKLVQGHEDFLEGFDGNTPITRLCSALKEYSRVTKILDEEDVDVHDLKGLKSKLKTIEDFEKNNYELEDRLKSLESL